MGVGAQTEGSYILVVRPVAKGILEIIISRILLVVLYPLERPSCARVSFREVRSCKVGFVRLEVELLRELYTLSLNPDARFARVGVMQALIHFCICLVSEDFMKLAQSKNWVLGGAMTDVKGAVWET